MHLLVTIDDARVQEEGPAYAEVLAGIKQTGIQVTEVVAATPGQDNEVVGLDTDSPLVAPMPLPWLQRSKIVSNLVRDIGRPLPDVVLCLGSLSANVALEIANAVDCPVIAECWLASHLKRPPLRASQVAGYVTASAGLASALRGRQVGDLVVTVPFPVKLPDLNHEAADVIPSIAVLGSELDHDSARCLLDGIRTVVETIPDLQICLELGTRTGDPTWKYAESIGLLDRISSISNASNLGPLVSQCTLTALASCQQTARSVVDLAMARGSVVIQADHAFLSEAEREQQCILLEATAEQWAKSILDLLNDPERRSRLGKASREHVARRNNPDVVISTWTQLIHEASKDVTYPFANTGTSGP